ncbi:aspartic peptidase domain-containing protein [Mycena rosella]|uniref:Aspartic peptidase domain-containing protein n=1 Tax=Mycena rosella TaxID=1033263 RepID=A0AAD7G990_MYCRO|nr:aspartic peptidase domain-containing protein [Mycena rosella]
MSGTAALHFRVAIDTGSSDLWVVTSPDFEYDITASVPVLITYGAGPVNGTVGFASMQLGDCNVSSQAFMNASLAGAALVLVDLGLDGLLGLSFGGPVTSKITEALSAQGPTAGQPFLYNLFDATPNQDNLIGICLSRTEDLDGSADASFTINEVDEDYSTVLDIPKIPLFPGDNFRWSILIDRVNINGVDVPLVSTVPNATNGSLVAVLDTGTPPMTFPPDILYAIYSQIPSASFKKEDDSFIIPCNASMILTAFIGGQPYALHPLDLSDMTTTADERGNNVTVCVSAIFMRNVYSVFNFGNTVAKSPAGAASMQLLSQTDPRGAIADVQNVRMAQLAKSPPEFQGLLSGYQHVTPGSTHPTDPSTDTLRKSGAVAKSPEPAGSSDSTIRQYAPIIIGLLAANLLVVLLLAAIGIALCVTRRGPTGGSSGAPPRYVSVKVKDYGESEHEDVRYSD